MKLCRRCQREKLEAFFYDDNRYRDGKYPYCKRCKRQMVLARYREVRELRKAA